jgi:single-stranded DNA-binding protein
MCKAPSQAILNHSWQDSMGFRVESWGDDAKRLNNLLYVGRQMALAGSLRYNTWQAQDGSHRATYQVRVRASQYSLFGKNQAKDTQQAAPALPVQQGGEVRTVVAAAPSSFEETVDPPF